MHPARQILQLLRKDIRAQAPAIGLVLLLDLLAVAVLTRTWPERIDAGEGITGVVLSALLIVAWCLLIARVIQDEGPAGKAPYWLTRPCSRGAVLAAKLVFVLLIVHLPAFLAQIAIVTGSGVPLSVTRVLFNQLVFFALVSLPAAAIASLTTGLSLFAPAAVLAAALGVIGIFDVGFLVGDPGISVVSGFDSATLLALVALIAGAALVCQYRWRSTLRIGIAGLVAVALLGVTMSVTSGLVQGVRATLAGSPTGTSTIRLRESPERYTGPSQRIDFSRGLTRVFVPLEWPIAEDVSINQVWIELREGGYPPVVMFGVLHLFGTTDELWLDLSMPRDLYEAIKDRPESLHLAVEFETFKPLENGTLPLDGSEAVIDGHAQCGTSPTANDWVLCRTSSGSTRLFIPRGVLGEYMRQPWLLRLTINPIVTLRMVRAASQQDGTTRTASVRQHLRYDRLEVTFDDIRLADWGPE
jgi:hypothetical protein